MDTHPCPRCGLESPFRLRPDTPHWGEIRCTVHGHSWIAKPGNEGKPRRDKSAKELLELIPADLHEFCWLCLRRFDRLQELRPPVHRKVHHVIEVKDGGLNEAANLQVLCGECHAETHRRRESFRRYETPEATADEKEPDW